jgi:hypothetical protein
LPERAHIVQPVCQLDQNDADIFAHRQEGFAQCFLREGAFARIFSFFGIRK